MQNVRIWSSSQIHGKLDISVEVHCMPRLLVLAWGPLGPPLAFRACLTCAPVCKVHLASQHQWGRQSPQMAYPYF